MKTEKQKNKTSKLTQVLINDLRGRRTVHHDFHGQNKVLWDKSASHKKTEQKRKPEPWWKTSFGAWSIVTGLAMVTLISLVAAIWPDIFRKPNIIAAPKNIAKREITPKYKLATTRTKKRVYRKKAEKKKKKYAQKVKPRQKSKRRVAKSKKKELHTWKDKNGIVHYTNLKGTVNKRTAKAKKEILGYTVNLKNGNKIKCRQILKIRNGSLRLLEKNIQIDMPSKEISDIEEKSQIRGKVHIRFLNPN